MQIINILSILILIIGCSSTPKGEYSRSGIERPYAAPDDIAKASFGYSVLSSEVTDYESDTIDEDSGSYSAGSPVLSFEQGISDNISWLYPLGVRWGIYQDEKNTVGISAASLLLANAYSVDYWRRINSKISLRPYHRGQEINFFLIYIKREMTGVELVYQHSDYLAIKPHFHVGKFITSSDFLEQIFTDLSESDIDSRSEGTLQQVGLSVLYSLSEFWDSEVGFNIETIKFDDYNSVNSTLNLQFTYIY